MAVQRKSKSQSPRNGRFRAFSVRSSGVIQGMLDETKVAASTGSIMGLCGCYFFHMLKSTHER